ncbi:AbrB family transcriptional regulator [Heyndrickxia camelliae]|uniref:AbrB family transcriptional regulator n=1 Tax=Heyndrickxia camelliae TaxID=1707093 RepID=A0A2N3LNX6_9BACI|nr:AbrB family transcriptional regulator [Heyndrickxia camelliae]PKR86328.1 AbrB family transcriptional regulator [Heyndrickxia camelliae]
MEKNKWIPFLLTFIISLMGGVVFLLIHMPIPWLLGPMVAVFLAARIGKMKLYWPVQLRNSGLIIVGYTIGLSFTKPALIQIVHQLPSMLLMTVLTIGISSIFAIFISKWTGVEYPTILTGSIPGGLSQMITLGEEIKGLDLTVVTFLQVTRLMMIIFFVPILVTSPIFAVGDFHAVSGKMAAGWMELFPTIIIFAIVSVAFALLGKKAKLPTPFLLGPIIGTAIINIGLVHGPNLPVTLTNFSQFLMGGYIGLLMKPDALENKGKIITFSLVSGFILILTSLGLSFLLVILHHVSNITSFLSVAPGGMDQMGIIAHAVHANLSIVTGYQLFRIFFIFFIVPPLLKWFFKRHYRKQKQYLP